MSKVKILTDSGCDLSEEYVQQHNIDIMPFEITLGDESFFEREITPQEFYDKIDNSEHLPKTAQITVLRFEEKFLEYVEKGYDEVIVVLINSTGSQTYQNAVLANERLTEAGRLGKTKLHIIDSHCYSIGYGYPIVEAAKKLEVGVSVPMVLAYLEDWFACCEIYIVGFALRHMKKSGRINAAAAFLGELMSLKPIISLIDGESVVVKKSRGEKNAVADAIDYIYKRAIPETPWLVLRTTVTELEDDFIKQYEKKAGYEHSIEGYAGCAVGANTGSKVIGVIVKGEKRR